MNEWKRYTLNELGIITTGNTPPKNDPSNYGDDYVWIRPPELNGTKYVFESSEKLSKNGAQKARIIKKGSVLVSCIGTIGKVSIAGKDLCTNQQINSITPKDSLIESEFLYYLIKYNIFKLQQRASSAIVPLLNKSEFSKITVEIPPLKIQQKISSILGKAETLKEKRNHSQQLIKDLFESLYYKVSLDKTSKIIGFLDIFDITTGKLDSNAMVKTGEYPFFTCAQETFKIDKYAFDCEALLLAGNNAEGKYSVKYYKGKFNAYQRTYILTLKDKSSLLKYFHFALQKKLEELRTKSIGSNTKYLTMGILKSVKLIVPPADKQKVFAEMFDKYLLISNKANDSSKQLDLLFNSLMQKAFKGELI